MVRFPGLVNIATDIYLFTIPVYAIGGLLLVILLFALRMTLTTGTINGFIFYAKAPEEMVKKYGHSNHTWTKMNVAFLVWINTDHGFSNFSYF